MTQPARSNGERLAAVKATLPRLERERDLIMARRREYLLADDIDGRRRCDDQLRALRDDLQAAHDKVELLGRAGPGVVQAQQPSGWTWPSTLADANAALLALEPRLHALQAIKPVDRHVGIDDEINFLVKRQYSLQRLLESLAPRSMVAT